MACVPTPHPQIPTPPAGFSFEPPGLPQFSGDIDLCCKTVHYSFAFPVSLGPGVINSTLLLAIIGVINTANAFIDSLEIPCPRD